MFVRFREMKAERYGPGERICAGKCKDRPRVYARHGIGMYVQGRTFLKGCPLKPLCPLAQPRTRLEVSIIETHREGGKVKQEHIASLGSVVGDGVRRAAGKSRKSDRPRHASATPSYRHAHPRTYA